MKHFRTNKFMSFVLAISIILVSLSFSVGAVETNQITTDNLRYTTRLMSVIDVKLNELKMIDNVDNLTIANVKTAHDLAGNEYKIIECAPSGYMIFNEETGVFTEYSSTASSPYLGYDLNLVYCGPTFYYVEDSTGDLHHLINTFEEIDSDVKAIFTQSCNDYYATLVADTNQLVVDYLNGDYQNQTFLQIVTATTQVQATPRTTTYGYLQNYEFFYNMQQCGYYSPPGSNGICGYIALGMLIAYKEKYNSSANYMDDIYWSDPTHNNLKGGTDSLAWHLRSNYGSDDSTYSTTIKETSQAYFTGRGVVVNHVSEWWGSFTKGTIMDSIDDDNPVLIFGSLFNPQNPDDNINHGVVAYKYSDESGLFGDTTFTAHYGWDGYENIYVSGLFGSIYILQ